VDTSCASACPSGESSAANQDEQSLAACMSGASTSCPACVADAGSVYGIIHESCPATKNAEACLSCYQNQCCRTYSACITDTYCILLDGCIVACPSDDILPDAGGDADAGFFPSCVEACLAEYPAGKAHYLPFYVCVDADCAETPACGGTPDPCESCLYGNCLQQIVDMNAADGGFGLYNCITMCGINIDCQMFCTAEFPAAQIPLNAFVVCEQEACSTICPASGGV
jgi:hypothetical protein